MPILTDCYPGHPRAGSAWCWNVRILAKLSEKKLISTHLKHSLENCTPHISHGVAAPHWENAAVAKCGVQACRSPAARCGTAMVWDLPSCHQSMHSKFLLQHMGIVAWHCELLNFQEWIYALALSGLSFSRVFLSSIAHNHPLHWIPSFFFNCSPYLSPSSSASRTFAILCHKRETGWLTTFYEPVLFYSPLSRGRGQRSWLTLRSLWVELSSNGRLPN